MEKKKKAWKGKLTRSVLARFFLTVILFSIVLMLLVLAAIVFMSQFIWYETDFLYQLLRPISDNLQLILLTVWGIGVLIIFARSWINTLSYIEQMIEASRQLTIQDETNIQLPGELREIEDQMNLMKQEAQRNARAAKEAEQRKNDLIVYLAHDLKTPLTSVIGYLTLLRDEPQISPEIQNRYLSVSLDRAERLEDLINEFFEITRFNLSNLTLEISRVNLTRMLEQISYEFQPLFAEKDLTCRLDVEPDIEIRCDIDKMERVFDNLIRNAVNYSFSDSEITIAAKKQQEGIWFRISNQGNTIPEEKLTRIFEQFYRLDSARTTKSGGAGLGLAIAKEVIEKHNGTIDAFSAEEVISFTVTLPYVVS